MIYNIGRGGGVSLTILTYVNKSGIEIARIMIVITKTLTMKLMVAATAMIINISFCCCPQMTRMVVCGVSVFPKNTITNRIK